MDPSPPSDKWHAFVSPADGLKPSRPRKGPFFGSGKRHVVVPPAAALRQYRSAGPLLRRHFLRDEGEEGRGRRVADSILPLTSRSTPPLFPSCPPRLSLTASFTGVHRCHRPPPHTPLGPQRLLLRLSQFSFDFDVRPDDKAPGASGVGPSTWSWPSRSATSRGSWASTPNVGSCSSWSTPLPEAAGRRRLPRGDGRPARGRGAAGSRSGGGPTPTAECRPGREAGATGGQVTSSRGS